MVNTRLSPVATGVIMALFICVFILAVAAGIGGDYLVMVHYIHNLQAQQIAAQVKSSIPLCKSLLQMDNASRPPVVNASHDPLSYGHKLASAIHQLYLTSHCAQILSGNYHPH